MQVDSPMIPTFRYTFPQLLVIEKGVPYRLLCRTSAPNGKFQNLEDRFAATSARFHLQGHAVHFRHNAICSEPLLGLSIHPELLRRSL